MPLRLSRWRASHGAFEPAPAHLHVICATERTMELPSWNVNVTRKSRPFARPDPVYHQPTTGRRSEYQGARMRARDQRVAVQCRIAEYLKVSPTHLGLAPMMFYNAVEQVRFSRRAEGSGRSRSSRARRRLVRARHVPADWECPALEPPSGWGLLGQPGRSGPVDDPVS